jgi:hypothetical protein
MKRHSCCCFFFPQLQNEKIKNLLLDFLTTFDQSPNICRTLHAALYLVYRALMPRSSSLVYHLSGRFVLTRVFSLGCGVSFLRHTHARPVSFYSTQGHPLALRGLRILVSCGSLLKHLSRDDITFEQTLLSTHALGTTFLIIWGRRESNSSR